MLHTIGTEPKKLTVAYKQVGLEPEILEIENNLYELRKYVEGYLESVHTPSITDPSMVIICNTEGRLIGMKPNLKDQTLVGGIIHGPVFIMSHSPIGESMSLSKLQQKIAMSWLRLHAIKYENSI